MPLIRPTGYVTLAAALLLAACSKSSPSELTGTSELLPDTSTGVEVRPAALTFTRNAQNLVEVPYSVVNGRTASVLLTTRCGDRLSPAVQRREGGEWVQHSGGGCFAIFPMSPVPLAAGARRDELEVISSPPPGQYRLLLGTELGPVLSTTFTVQ